MKIVGVGHIQAQETIIKLSKRKLDVILLPGIGDIIYTWYKLINYVNEGYNFNVKVLDCEPKRSHQIFGCLEGMSSFDYIRGFEYYRYWLVNFDDIRTTSLYGTFNKMPVLHINSFLETGQHIDTFMPNYPANYDIKLNLPEENQDWAKKQLNENYYNILLYTSSYNNNINCKTHPDPKYWADLALLSYEFSESEKPLCVHLTGASYDADLTIDTHNELKNRKINSILHVDQEFKNMMALTKFVDFLVCYESGFAMIADCFKTKMFHVIRCQGGDRDDKKFPFLGPINPEGIWNRYWPVFYDETIEQIREKICN